LNSPFIPSILVFTLAAKIPTVALGSDGKEIGMSHLEYEIMGDAMEVKVTANGRWSTEGRARRCRFER
jgi:hypothetical protein